MKRNRSGKKRVEEIKHGPFIAVIRMDDQGVFSCDYGAISTSGTLPQVREWAKATLRQLSALDWSPVMEVNFDSEDDYVNKLKTNSNLRCVMERFWIAWDGKKWIQCPWVVDPRGTFIVSGPANSDREQPVMPADELMERRIACSREFYNGPEENVIKWPMVTDSHRGKTYYVPYSEETWAIMLGILERLRELRSGINKLLSTGTGWKTLAKVAQTKLLTDAK